jgi:hypothetical protein
MKYLKKQFAQGGKKSFLRNIELKSYKISNKFVFRAHGWPWEQPSPLKINKPKLPQRITMSPREKNLKLLHEATMSLKRKSLKLP